MATELSEKETWRRDGLYYKKIKADYIPFTVAWIGDDIRP